MSGAKSRQVHEDIKFEHAIYLCLEIGAMSECGVHDGIYVDSMEYMNYEKLTTLILEQDPEAIESFDDREELVASVRQAMHNAGEDCGICSKNRDTYRRQDWRIACPRRK